MNGPTLCSVVRELIKTAQVTGSRYYLTEIADMAEVNYARLWRFSNGKTDTLPADEAQRVYQALTGKPLITERHASNK